MPPVLDATELNSAIVRERHRRRSRMRIGNYVDYCRFARSGSAFERRADILRLIDVLAVRAEDFGHLVVARETEVAPRDHPAKCCPSTVIVDDGEHWDVMADHRVDFHPVHAERAVAAQHDYLGVGLRDLGPHPERHRDSHTTVWTGVHGMAR